MNFRISDIPEGKSDRNLTVESDKIDLNGTGHGQIDLHVSFTKAHGIIQVSFNARTTLTLKCDRSLDKFDYPVDCSYEILFKPDVEPSEDESFAVRPMVVSKNTISIENEVRDSILLSIPIKKLHPRFLNEDGTPTEFIQTFGPSGKSEDKVDGEPVDARWEALKKLKINQNN